MKTQIPRFRAKKIDDEEYIIFESFYAKDESYYFMHCKEVYDGLFQHDLIMESEEL